MALIEKENYLIGWKNEKDQQQLNLPRRPNAAHAEA
jgi:hypothetical protein